MSYKFRGKNLAYTWKLTTLCFLYPNSWTRRNSDSLLISQFETNGSRNRTIQERGREIQTLNLWDGPIIWANGLSSLNLWIRQLWTHQERILIRQGVPTDTIFPCLQFCILLVVDSCRPRWFGFQQKNNACRVLLVQPNLKIISLCSHTSPKLE